MTYRASLGEMGLVLQDTSENCDPAWHLYTVRTRRREILKTHLQSMGIETLIHYARPPHLHKAFSYLNYKPGSLPKAEKISEQTLSIPMGPHLSMEKQQEVIEAILSL